MCSVCQDQLELRVLSAPVLIASPSSLVALPSIPSGHEAADDTADDTASVRTLEIPANNHILNTESIQCELWLRSASWEKSAWSSVPGKQISLNSVLGRGPLSFLIISSHIRAVASQQQQASHTAKEESPCSTWQRPVYHRVTSAFLLRNTQSMLESTNANCGSFESEILSRSCLMYDCSRSTDQGLCCPVFVFPNGGMCEVWAGQTSRHTCRVVSNTPGRSRNCICKRRFGF